MLHEGHEKELVMVSLEKNRLAENEVVTPMRSGTISTLFSQLLASLHKFCGMGL